MLSASFRSSPKGQVLLLQAWPGPPGQKEVQVRGGGGVGGGTLRPLYQSHCTNWGGSEMYVEPFTDLSVGNLLTRTHPQELRRSVPSIRPTVERFEK